MRLRSAVIVHRCPQVPHSNSTCLEKACTAVPQHGHISTISVISGALTA